VIAIDTNVLVRILVDDPGQPAQVAAARRLASESCRWKSCGSSKVATASTRLP
jgi:predicted nucleic-acid-binding protein